MRFATTALLTIAFAAGCGGTSNTSDAGADVPGDRTTTDAVPDVATDARADVTPVDVVAPTDVAPVDATTPDAHADVATADVVTADVARADVTTADVARDAQSCAACVLGQTRWGNIGGRAPSVDESRLDLCDTFTLTRTFGSGAPSLMCSNTVTACGGGATSIAAVAEALADPEMHAAIEAAPVLYGTDTRPFDGAIFRINASGRTVDIGADCTGSPGCVAIPPGVAYARDVLRALTAQQRALAPCDTVLP